VRALYNRAWQARGVLALLTVVISIGLADSANPSTIAPALYLATEKNAPRSIAGFIVGVFVVYLAGGLVLTFGPGPFLLDALPHPRRETVHAIELALGVGALLLALVLWLARDRVATHLGRHERRVGRSSILLGGAIMAVELPTAFPYFAVIAAVVGSHTHVLTRVALLVLFNVLFVAPLVVILAVVVLSGERGARKLEQAHALLHRHGPVLLPVLIFVVAIVLILIGSLGLARD
jgi:cytochrome c biogenesis protein CcdA